MKCSMTTLLVLGYIIGGFATFGWIYNHNPQIDVTDRSLGGALGGMAWPAYWAGTIAIKATAP